MVPQRSRTGRGTGAASTYDAAMREIVARCLLVSVCVAAAGCSPSALSPSAYPPDFAMVFHVSGEPGAADPMLRTAQHVVDPARHLRVMLGAGVTAADYPPTTARLSQQQMAYLYRMALAALDDPAPPPGAGAEVVYLVTLTANGRTDTRGFDAESKPPPAATPLLRRLVTLRGGR